MAETTSLHLRLPKKLYKRLQQQARRNNVSLNTEIVNQLEGYEAATVKRTTEIVEPLLKEAVRAAAETGAEAMLLGIFRPRTEEELLERLEQADASDDFAARVRAAFRERQAPRGGGVPAKEPEQK